MNFPPGTQVFILDADGKLQSVRTAVAHHDPSIGRQITGIVQGEMHELVTKLESIRQMHARGALRAEEFENARRWMVVAFDEAHIPMNDPPTGPKPRAQPWYQKFNRKHK